LREHLNPWRWADDEHIPERLPLGRLTAGQGVRLDRPTAVLHNSGVTHNVDEEPEPILSFLGMAGPDSPRLFLGGQPRGGEDSIEEELCLGCFCS
jgi:hypothetical protein